MSVVEQIQTMKRLRCEDNEDKMYEEALKEYHKMIDDGIIEPRGNHVLYQYSPQHFLASYSQQ